MPWTVDLWFNGAAHIVKVEGLITTRKSLLAMLKSCPIVCTVYNFAGFYK
jgi:hypothetical protein